MCCWYKIYCSKPDSEIEIVEASKGLMLGALSILATAEPIFLSIYIYTVFSCSTCFETGMTGSLLLRWTICYQEVYLIASFQMHYSTCVNLHLCFVVWKPMFSFSLYLGSVWSLTDGSRVRRGYFRKVVKNKSSNRDKRNHPHWQLTHRMMGTSVASSCFLQVQ